MTMNALALPAAAPGLRLLNGGDAHARASSRASWWERRSLMRSLVGGCPDHWWKPTAPRTAACTCDRY